MNDAPIGALILIAPLLYTTGNGFVFPGPPAEFFAVRSGPDLANPNLLARYWLATIAGGIAMTVWWYRRRARRAGVEVLVIALALWAGRRRAVVAA